MSAALPRKPRLRLLSVRTIWSEGRHNAFTDLVRFQGKWLCAFREASGHARGSGKIRILASDDGVDWRTVHLASERGIDLRDPKLSVAPGGRLMLLAGGTRFREGLYLGRQPRVAFSTDGERWEPARVILSDGDWLWRVTWFRGRAYGVTYRLESRDVWTVTLLESEDAIAYRELAALRVDGKPNEATIRFRDDGEAVLVVRREGGDGAAWVGSSRPPYRRFRWHSFGCGVGGPNLLLLPAAGALFGGRMIVDGEARMVLAEESRRRASPLLVLPSGGDCGYPGMVSFRGAVWVSYYSSHEGKASIYLARVHME